jgi:hypothetical protein
MTCRSIAIALIIGLGVGFVRAQSWGGSEGSGIIRVGPLTLGSPYDRPGLFFLRRPEAVLAPAYSSVYPYAAYRYSQSGRTAILEIHPVEKHATVTYAQARRVRGSRR